ncbi:uncharacterized protein N7479_003151 [Penicillium vulpinum]|uniref:NmrA-like domain-containing protein n=1 Tax=Penicillium vulpinum TaxID=29845 RepID=A0A1V6S4K7_9EURO|nr:uncharacterized protein N7479_003151 [Penicillium vulpinum]KAJ5963275.1 hypothetical protein N7479_003151 [Penicillium vulpinum]OQE08670.1 hypothetical protein PENVUL_c009G06496 [Penicillium vulpinum]
MASNYIINVAIAGASGNSGGIMTDALLKTGRHTITAITRAGGQSKLPDGVIVKPVDYSKLETIVEALKGQDALIIALNGYAPPEIDMMLIKAAGDAGVPWIFPNEWAPDTANEDLAQDLVVFQSKGPIRKAITDLGKSSYIAVNTGFWYEWSLAIPSAFGIDFANRTVTLFDEGKTKISTSTWPQVGRTVASLCSMPIKAEGNGGACLENLKNQIVYVDSFTVSQIDMLESVFRVTGITEQDWTITKESAKERYENGLKEMHQGDRIGFVKMLYTRIFFDDGAGNFESKGTLNSLLGLPKEDIDEVTRAAIERSKTVTW